jgi:hypothetical protein
MRILDLDEGLEWKCLAEQIGDRHPPALRLHATDAKRHLCRRRRVAADDDDRVALVERRRELSPFLFPIGRPDHGPPS